MVIKCIACFTLVTGAIVARGRSVVGNRAADLRAAD